MNFKATDPNTMIAETGRQLLEQLRSVSGATNEAFQQSYVPLLYRLAQFVQNLPLDKVSHSEPRGAFRFGVTSALLTMRMADGVLFSTSFGGEMMSKLNPQFRLAAFAASLATVPLLVHHNIQIMLGDADWSYLDAGPTLYDRLKNGHDDCAIKWKSPAKPPVSAMGMVVLAQFFDPGIWAHFHPIVFEEMCVAINPSGVQATVETQLSKIVRLGHEKARLIDESARTPLYTAPVAPLSTPDAIAHAMQAPVPGSAPATVVSSHVAAPVVATQTPPPSPGEVVATYPPEFMEWLAAIKNSPDHYPTLIFNERGTVTVPATALAGFGMSPRLLLEKFAEMNLIVEKDPKARTATFISAVTPLFHKS